MIGSLETFYELTRPIACPGDSRRPPFCQVPRAWTSAGIDGDKPAMNQSIRIIVISAPGGLPPFSRTGLLPAPRIP